MGTGHLPHSPKIPCELFWKILNKELTTSPYLNTCSQIASVDSMLELLELFKWVKYPIPLTGFTGATGNGVYGYKNCVDKMVSQCSIGYDFCSLDRYFRILYANHRSLISWFGYVVNLKYKKKLKLFSNSYHYIISIYANWSS